jgi:hypothetical protein
LLRPPSGYDPELIGQKTHDAIGQSPKAKRPQQDDNTAGEEQFPDGASHDDTVEAASFGLDIRRKLTTK